MIDENPSILWKRLDGPGHDACHVDWVGDGWALEGVSAGREEGQLIALSWRIRCDQHWRTRRGRITGWVNSRRVDHRVRRASGGVWTLDDQIIPGLDDCIDLDLGFTPATNLIQLRRTTLAIGKAADVPVAWLDIIAGTLQRLEQRYERRSESTWWYESPAFNYAELLEVGPEGFVRRYPRLWEAEG